MNTVAYRGGPLDGQQKHFVLHVPARVPVTAHEGRGWSNVDCYYELVDGVLVWQGPER